MPRLKDRLTYANVAATIALVAALTMGSAWASGHLAKNSVGTKQLKDNAVNGAKVADGSLSGADIGGSVGSADHATKADSAADADHASHADSADSATSATNAGHAANSDQLGGSPPSAYFSSARVQRIDYSPSGCLPICVSPLVTVAGFTLIGHCVGNGSGSSSEAKVDVSAAPGGGTANFSYIHNVNVPVQGGFGGTGTTFDLTNNGSQSQGGVGTVVLHTSGATVSIELHVFLSSNYIPPANLAFADCQFFGTVLQA